eukprot:scaffold236401_cov29-Tisochrysis_lutea.AAC.4
MHTGHTGIVLLASHSRRAFCCVAAAACDGGLHRPTGDTRSGSSRCRRLHSRLRRPRSTLDGRERRAFRLGRQLRRRKRLARSEEERLPPALGVLAARSVVDLVRSTGLGGPLDHDPARKVGVSDRRQLCGRSGRLRRGGHTAQSVRGIHRAGERA